MKQGLPSIIGSMWRSQISGEAPEVYTGTHRKSCQSGKTLIPSVSTTLRTPKISIRSLAMNEPCLQDFPTIEQQVVVFKAKREGISGVVKRTSDDEELNYVITTF